MRKVKKMKIKFNWIDGLIIFVVVAVIAVGGYILLNRGDSAVMAKNARIEIMVEFDEMEKGFAEIPKVGDKATVGIKEKAPVEITKVDVLPAKKLNYDIVNGAGGDAEIPERYDVQVTFVADGVDTGDTIEIGGIALRVGEETAVKSKEWAGFGTVLVVNAEHK